MATYYTDIPTRGWLSNYQAKIAADTDTTLTVPADAEGAFIFADHPFWVDDAAITLPSASSFATTTALKNPSHIVVTAGDTLHFRSREVQDIYVAFHSS